MSFRFYYRFVICRTNLSMIQKTILSLLFAFVWLSGFSQTQPADKTFTQQDWDKLSQHQKDSINKDIFEKFSEAKQAAASINETNANNIIAAALKNIEATTTLNFTNFPKPQLSNEITKFKNLEEFSCTGCRTLDLNYLFTQLAQLPKLKNLNLSGGAYTFLPASIKNLTALKNLNLKDNNFKTLPDSLIALQQLRELNLEHNAYLYDDEVYDRLKYMQVEDLNFSASGLLGLNNKIGEVKSLKELDLSVNDIKVFPESFKQLNNLQELNLSQNFNLDKEKVVAALALLPQLTELDLSQCLIENLPVDIGKLTALKKLNLKANRLSALPITFGSLVNIEELDLGYLEMGTRMNKITDLGPGFGNLKKLKKLDLAGNSLTTLPDAFSNLTALTELNLNLNKLAAFPLAITPLTQLKKLDLGLNDISVLPADIARLSQLETLNVDGNFFNRSDKKITLLPAEICQLKNLETLSLKDNVIEQLPDCIGQLQKLEKLNLRDNLLTSFPTSFSQLKKLEWLDVKANDFSELPSGFQNLSAIKELDLSMNPKLSFDAERLKFAQMQNLNYLNLSYNNISKEQIEVLRNSLPNCKVVNWDYSKTVLPRPEKMRNAPPKR